MKERVLSGIRATGRLHIGNYIGALKKFLMKQEQGDECFFFIADYHTLTTETDPNALRQNIIEVAKDYLAAGIHPDRSALYRQSDVPELTELSALISNLMPVGELLRCTTYKEKVRQQPDNVNAGLLMYPVLMSADILGPKSTVVPVGADQKPHLEMCQNLAERFNKRYGETFIVPKGESSIRVPSLSGSEKMSKSEDDGGSIVLAEPAESVQKKVRGAITDPRRVRRDDPGEPNDCTVFTFHQHLSTPDELAMIAPACRTAEIGCVDCKKILNRNIEAVLEPFREKRAKLTNDDVEDVLAQGAQQVRSIVQSTVNQVRERMGISQI
jgi:tryptophanyl-tRNA synthetase